MADFARLFLSVTDNPFASAIQYEVMLTTPQTAGVALEPYLDWSRQCPK